jgi:glutathione synthase/RimK-type ligase-like ATP-grasp enzyme
MKGSVLILSDTHDPHASAVAWGLRRNNVEPVVTPSLRCGESSYLSVTSNEEGDGIAWGSECLNFHSVWYRRPRLPEIGRCTEADRDFVVGQWKYLQKNVFNLAENLIGGLWVNHPHAAEYAESKLVQLRIARAAGLRVPETIVSNDVARVRGLIARWGRVVFKTFYPQSWRNQSSGRVFSMSAAMLDGSSELPEEAIAMTPGIYQRYIEKIFDIRVSVIGDKLFAIKMLKATGEAYFDWRSHSHDADMRAEVFEVSADLEAKLRKVMSSLGIVFGCVELVADSEGNLYFLEINQAGQFLFVEDLIPEFPILRAMTAMLCAGRCDYGESDSINLNFAEYLDSEDYQFLVRDRRCPPRALAIEP